jgi:CDP-diacylglycerol--glycerol-3-phosphate 3-phosphatidyltransferase
LKRQLGNLMTIGRLLLAVVFLALLSMHRPHAAGGWVLLDAALVLFILAGITDLLDGYLARRYDAVSRFGRILDPFVDKVLICGAFILFVSPPFLAGGRSLTAVAPWMPVVVVCRELLVTSLRGMSESNGTSFGATWAGKLKMVCQSAAVMWILFHLAHVRHIGPVAAASWVFLQVLVWIAIAATAFSALLYVGRFLQLATSSTEGK